jgi:hypothetical protein
MQHYGTTAKKKENASEIDLCEEEREEEAAAAAAAKTTETVEHCVCSFNFTFQKEITFQKENPCGRRRTVQ